MHRAVLRIEPRRRSSFATQLQGHQLRADASIAHDPARSHLNRILVGSADIVGELNALLAKYPPVSSRSVEAVEYILTASSAYFDEISPDWKTGKFSAEFKSWVENSVNFIRAEHGEGLASAVLHLDEGAPHIHFNVVPILTFEKRFRRGSKIVTKSNYSHFFNDPKSVLMQAKINHDPSLTKLGRLQTRYANAVISNGLTRGVVGSARRHTTTTEWTTHVNNTLKSPAKPRLESEIELTTLERINPTSESRRRKEEIVERNRLKKERYQEDFRDYLATLRAKAVDRDFAKSENDSMIKNLESKQNTIDVLRIEVTKANQEIDKLKAELSKERKDKLRKTDLSLIAHNLTYHGPLTNSNGKPKWRNAVDMVMELSGYTADEAFQWIATEVGYEALSNAADDHAIDTAKEAALESKKSALQNSKMKRPLPLTKQQYAVTKELEKQLNALDAPLYRVTLMHSEASRTYNLGKKEGGPDGEKFYSKDELLKKVPFLNTENGKNAYNIFITPIDDEHRYILVDDLTAQTLPQLQSLNVVPCVVQKSSRQSIQAIIKVGSSLERKDGENYWFKWLNRSFGDPKISGLIHPFRAAGFRNVKPKHRLDTGFYPTVTLLRAAKNVCIRAFELISEAMNSPDYLADRQRTTRARSIAAVVDHVGRPESAPAALSALYNAYRNELNARYGVNTDHSRVDYGFAKLALIRGASEADIIATIAINRPDLLKTKQKPADYVSRTVSAAKNTL